MKITGQRKSSLNKSIKIMRNLYNKINGFILQSNASFNSNIDKWTTVTEMDYNDADGSLRTFFEIELMISHCLLVSILDLSFLGMFSLVWELVDDFCPSHEF